MSPRRLGLVVGVAIFASATPAHATYSIAAFDRDTGRFGGVTASCVPLEVLRMVYAEVPGEGAVLTQSYLLPNGAAHEFALSALAEGQPAQAVLAGLTDAEFDADFALRQYAVLDPSGGVASFTGAMAEPFASDTRFTSGAFEVVVAGNFLTGQEVLLDAKEGFSGEGCDLEARLMNALVAASADDQGDARCVIDGTPAQSALIHVGRDEEPLELEVGMASPPTADPVQALAGAFADWRSTHPCPVAEPPDEDPPASTPASTGGCATGHDGRTGWGWLLGLALLLRRRRPVSAPRAGRRRSS